MEQPITRRPWKPSPSVFDPPRPSRNAPRWLWPVLGLVVVAGSVATLVWRGVIPIERLRSFLPRARPEPVEVRTLPPRPPALPVDTAGTRTVVRPASRSVRASEPPSLPPGAFLTGMVYVVLGSPVASLEETVSQNRLGFRIVQVLDSGERIVLEEFPADAAVEEEFGAITLPGDTLVAQVRLGGVDITLKGVVSDELAADLLQRLGLVRW